MLCCLLFLTFLPFLCVGQGVLTCSGVIKSDQPIDFTRIDIHLLTKLGVVKETSDCSPTNGYFLLPVYDKGEYIIRVAPPAGWGFNPSEVSLNVDGSTDACSKDEDIIFYLTGFTLTGQVLTFGQDSGPAGVTVSLASISSEVVVKETLSTEDGRYIIDNVFPGQYVIEGRHSVWSVRKSQVKVEVTADSLTLPIASIIVEGFDVKGYIESKGEPVAGVQFQLYPQNESQSSKLSCDSVSSSGVCVAVSSVDGVFIYPFLPPGDYRLVPRYENADSKFQVFPIEVSLTVLNDSVIVEPKFEVHGFTVFGRVLSHNEGSGLEGAKVDLGGNLQTVTSNSGHYQFLNISTGTYTIKVVAISSQFDPITVEVNPSSPYLPDIVPSRYSVCGHVSITAHHTRTRFVTESRTVELVSDSASSGSTEVDSKGNFCFMLAPGKYKINVKVSSKEANLGLSLFPKVLSVTVETSPLTGLEFKQFIPSLSGSLSCLRMCRRVNVILVSQAAAVSNQTTKVDLAGDKGSFKFDQVLPGEYRVLLDDTLQWCWSKEELEVTVSSSPHDSSPPVSFNQTGYLLVIHASHDTHVDMFEGEDLIMNLTVKKGLNNMCIGRSGQFSVVPNSCHQFPEDMMLFLTDIPIPFTLKAVSHIINVSVHVPRSNGSVQLVLTNSKTHKFNSLSSFSTETDTEGDTVHHYSFIERPGALISLIAKSADFFCSPVQLDYTVGEDCPESLPSFSCRKGFFINGHIEPPLVGVSITIATEVDDIKVTTDEKGQYRVGPLLGTVQYTVVPSHDGYVFEALSEDPYSFNAMKKSQLVVKVSDKDPLGGVFISLSGEGLRNSSMTSEDGSVVYTDISPGQYYIKPLLREFEFQPPSMVIKLKQGDNLSVDFIAKRVAFSCKGKVSSLNGTPLGNVRLELSAEGEVDSCNGYQDTTVSDSEGVYKFRGLQPHCIYQLSLDIGEDSSVERGLPNSRNITLTDTDIEGENFIAVMRYTKVVVTGNVAINSLHLLGHVKVGLYTDKYLESQLSSVGTDPVGFFHLPALSLYPPKTYFLKVGTSLSPQTYKIYVTPANVSFTANMNKHFTFQLRAESIPLTNGNGFRGSIFGLFVAIFALFAIVNINKIYALRYPVKRESYRR